MYNEAEVPKKFVSSKNTNGNKMRGSGNGISRKVALLIVFTFSIVILVDHAHSLPHALSIHRRTIRLCSRSLSDALFLLCREHGGYNGPFTYSGEVVQRRPYSGPGLVEECCYRPCSFDQLEQYCKPLDKEDNNGNSHNGIEESVRIVNLPDDSPKEAGTEKRDVATRDEENIQWENKSKLRSVTGMRRAGHKGKRRKHAEPPSQITILSKKSHKGRRLRGHKDVPHAKQNNDGSDSSNSPTARVVRARSKHNSRHHKQPKRPLRFKLQAPRNAAIAKVPGFKVGTTLPDPKDSTIHIFPSRTNLAMQRTATDLAASENTEKLE